MSRKFNSLLDSGENFYWAIGLWYYENLVAVPQYMYADWDLESSFQTIRDTWYTLRDVDLFNDYYKQAIYSSLDLYFIEICQLLFLSIDGMLNGISVDFLV